ncbi:MAG: hypothetical protein O2904_02155 [bacterium]|nr:hypothetical protein [bacterium]
MSSPQPKSNGHIDILIMASAVFRTPGFGMCEMTLCGEDFYSAEGLASRAEQRTELLEAVRSRYDQLSTLSQN